VLGILLAVAPFFVTIFHRVPLPLLFLPVLLVVFLYPLFTPFGIPYDRDSIYVFQFAQHLATAARWTPAVGVTNQGIVYSYYPGVGIFLAEAATLTGLPIASTFSWSTDLLRLLIIPPLLFALTARLFTPRAAPLAVLLYLVEPSIEMNVPTQTDFAVVFFLLVVAVLAFLAVDGRTAAAPLVATAGVMGAVVILSHHVSTYLLLGMLAALAFLPLILWRRDPYPNARALPMFVGLGILALLWADLVAQPVLRTETAILDANLLGLIRPTTATTAIPGASFPAFEIVWVVLGVVAIAAVAIVTLYEAKRRDDVSFVTMALLSVLLLGILSIPFLSTGFSFLALREFEFTGVILAPVCAWFAVTRLAGRGSGSAPGARASGTAPPRRARRLGTRQGAALAIGLVALLVTAGSLVPLSTRDQFSPKSADLIDSPMFIDQNSYAAATWAKNHLDLSNPVWGDMLAYSVIGGFGGFRMVYDSYPLFNGTGFNSSVVARMSPGDYVVLDPHMLTYFAPPMFPGTASEQPTTGINPADLVKFQDPAYFAEVFDNPSFTIYVTRAVPPPG
jgi:hypothetical protein